MPLQRLALLAATTLLALPLPGSGSTNPTHAREDLKPQFRLRFHVFEAAPDWATTPQGSVFLQHASNRALEGDWDDISNQLSKLENEGTVNVISAPTIVTFPGAPLSIQTSTPEHIVQLDADLLFEDRDLVLSGKWSIVDRDGNHERHLPLSIDLSEAGIGLLKIPVHDDQVFILTTAEKVSDEETAAMEAERRRLLEEAGE